MKIIIIDYWQFNNVEMVATDWWTKMDPTKRYVQRLAKGNDDTLQTVCMYFERLNLLLFVNPELVISWHVRAFIWLILAYTQARWWICLCVYEI